MEITISTTVALAIVVAVLFITITVIDKDTAKSLAAPIVNILKKLT